MDGVAKIDLEEQDPKKAVAGVYRFEDDWVGGESYFVPASEDPAACDGEQAQLSLTSHQGVHCFFWAWVHLAAALAGCASQPFSHVQVPLVWLQFAVTQVPSKKVNVALHPHCR